MKRKHSLKNIKKPLAIIIPLVMASQVNAIQFYKNGVDVSFNSDLSIGSSWRVENVNSNLQQDNNVDDGELNYNKGDAFSQVFKGTHSLSLDYENFGAFIRGKYWYDSALENNSVNHGNVNTASLGGNSGQTVEHNGGRLDDSGFDNLSKFKGAALLDAFFYGVFDLGDVPVDVRLGRQVVSWGESTFIRGGVNSINALDINAFTRAGAEVKEGLLPTNMVYLNLGLTNDLSMETFYLLEFQETVMPGCGTYFSATDTLAQGCDMATISFYESGVKRDEDGSRKPSFDGQFGFALRYVAESLGETEFSLYWKTQHNTLPTISGTNTTYTDDELNTAGLTSVGQALQVSPGLTQSEQGLAYIQGFGRAYTDGATFLTEYVEDQELYGLSFASSVGSLALSGEVSHKPNVPLQINEAQFTLVSTGAGAIADLVGINSTILKDNLDTLAAGEYQSGYRLHDASQAQFTVIKLIDSVLGAEQISLVGEYAFTYVHGLEEGANQIKFGGSEVGTASTFDTAESMGIQLLAKAEYSDAFMGINLNPKLAYSEGLDGNAPNAMSGFKEDNKSMLVGLDADYLNIYKGSLSYTQYWGGEYNRRADRDYFAASIGVQF